MSDLRRLAQAVLDSYSYEDDRGRNAYTGCIHCLKYVYWNTPFPAEKHDKECPVVLATKVIESGMWE